MYKLVDQNSALKKEAGIAERKLLARNERIQNLEALLQDADRRLALQNQKFEAQLQAVKDRLDQARGAVFPSGSAPTPNSEFLLAQKGAVSSPLSFAGRIAKPLRGGGGGGIMPSATTETPAATVVSANPITRVQNEERYAIVSFTIVASLDLRCSLRSGGKFPMCRISFDQMVTHCVFFTAKRASWFFQSRS